MYIRAPPFCRLIIKPSYIKQSVNYILCLISYYRGLILYSFISRIVLYQIVLKRCLPTLKLQPLNKSFVFTNYQPIQRTASYNRAVRIMHRYCIMQQGIYVSNTIY